MKLDIKVETTVAKFNRTITTNSVTNNLQSHSFLRNGQEKKNIELVNNHQYQQEIVHSSRMSPTSPSHNLTSITPPPSPSPKSKLRYSQKTLINRESRSNIDILADDLIDMYEKALHQCNAAENRYKRLDLTMKSTLSLHTQTYETCIQELKEKIKQLERANHVYRNSHSLTENSSRLSSSFTDNTLSLSSSLTDNSLSLSSSLNHDPIQLNHEIKKLNEPSRDTALKEEIDILKEQIRLSEQSVQQVMAHYIRELEQERAKTKKLKQVIDKQDLLIETLESKLSSSLKGRGDEEEERKSSGNHYHLSQSSAVMTARKSEKLLEAQIEIQGIELEDKKKLLSILIDERDVLLKKIEQLSKENSQLVGNQNNNNNNNNNSVKCHHSHASEPTTYQYKKKNRGRSSIDLLAKIAKFDVTSQQPNNHHSKSSVIKIINASSSATTIPPSPPPKNPLPPIPPPHQTNPTILMNFPPYIQNNKTSTPTTKYSTTPKSFGRSWSCLNYEVAKDSSSYFAPPSNHEQKPAYCPIDDKSPDKEWRESIIKDFHYPPHNKANSIQNNHHLRFSSILKNWRKRTVT